MIAAVQDARVIRWMIDQADDIATSEIPDGWQLVEIVGGPYDGLQFPVPPTDPDRQILLTLPTTPRDRPGGPCFAFHRIDQHIGRAWFRCVGALPEIVSEPPRRTRVDVWRNIRHAIVITATKLYRILGGLGGVKRSGRPGER